MTVSLYKPLFIERIRTEEQGPHKDIILSFTEK